MVSDRTPPPPDHVDRLAQWLYESAPRRSDVGRFAWSALPEDGVGGKAHHRQWAESLLASEEWQAREAVMRNRPRIVCLCGSTRFWETFRDVGLRLTLEGHIVLSIGTCAPDSMILAHPESEEGKAQKARLDLLHRHKIDLADEILVLNVSGYVGDSTMGEIAHALRTGKAIRWLENDSSKEILARLAAMRGTT